MNSMNNRAFFVSWRELTHKIGQAKKEFLWVCYLQFRDRVISEHEDNLVLCWESDYNKLFDFYMQHFPSGIIKS